MIGEDEMITVFSYTIQNSKKKPKKKKKTTVQLMVTNKI